MKFDSTASRRHSTGIVAGPTDVGPGMRRTKPSRLNRDSSFRKSKGNPVRSAVGRFHYPLVNSHTHVAMIAFRGLVEDLPVDEWWHDYIWPWEKKKVNAEFVYKHSRKAIREMKKNGIKLFNDMYFFEEEVGRVAEEEKIHAVIGEAILDHPTPNAKTPQEGLAYTEGLFKKFKGSKYVRVAVAPHSVYTLSEKHLIKAKEMARKHNATCHIHCSETEDEYDECLLKHGATPVGYLEKLGLLDEKTVLVHCVYLCQDDLNLIAKREAKIVHCPLSNLKSGSGVSSVAKLLKRGVTVALGTDGAASSNRLDIWEAGKFAALLQKGLTHDPTQLPAKQAVKMMTTEGLKALGFKEFEGKSVVEIEKKIDQAKGFNYLYELNAGELSFF